MRSLLLNADHSIIKSISWQQAICMVLVGKAYVLENYPKKIKCSQDLNFPAVVCLKRYIPFRQSTPLLNNDNLFIRDGFRCGYCGGKFSPEKLTRDHIVPQVTIKANSEKKSLRRKLNSWENLITSCWDCNMKKGGRTPEEAKMPMLFHPFTPSTESLWARAELPPEWGYYVRGRVPL